MKKLVGEGKPLHSSLDRAAGLLKRKVGTGAEFMKELMGIPGIKQTEIQERGLGEVLGMPRMTHDQFMANLAIRPVPAIHEKVFANKLLRNPGSDPDPHHEQWTLPGGDNYREMLIKAPKGVDNEEKIMELEAKLRRTPMFDSTPEQQADITKYHNQIRELKEQEAASPKPFQGVVHHFGGEPGILASMRLKDRTGPNGEKLLHLEELQSDWHQQGREHGYATKENLENWYNQNKLADDPAFSELNSEQIKIIERNRSAGMGGKSVPDAPFKKNWEEMALKRLIHHAAEKGYHGVVVTPGAEQADRYSLAKHIDALHYNPDTHRLIGKKNGRVLIDEVSVPPDKLESHVGKEAAQKVMAQEPNVNGLRSLLGEDLRVGGEGMKGFYDKKVPNILNSIGKKYGVKTELNGHKLPGDPSQRGDASELLGVAGVRFADMNPQQIQAFNQKLDDSNAKQLHYFPITEDMRKDVLTNGLPLYAEGGIIHKAEGGNVQPSLTQMKMEIAQKANPITLKNIGVNEAPGMFPKTFFPPEKQYGGVPAPGGVATPSGMPIGGVDTSEMEPGQQLMPQGMAPPAPPAPPEPQGGLPGQPPAPGGAPGAPAGPTPPMGNMLQMTPQGQALGAMKPPQQAMADGGSAKSVDAMKAELAAKKQNKANTSTRIKFDAEGPNGVKGIVVPRHMWEGSEGVYSKGDRKGQKFKNEGMRDINAARAQVYGAENRDPLTIGKIGKIHEDTLKEHFSRPLHEQHEAEEAALNRLREAKHIKRDADTLDESEKLDTVRHEEDAQGRTHVGFASKGVAGHSLYTSGHGENMKHHVINTCPGQTVGCGGGTDKNGIVDTSQGTCFAPNAEQQYVNAAVRRAAHEQAKHDPAMTRDWILSHTHSLRNAARLADKNNKRLLFRPNVVDETDVSSRHVIRHLNDQRKADGKPPIVANSYGKTNELHDPENGYHVTHSNVGPKVKKGEEIAENIGRDKARVQNTIMAADNKGDFKNEQGNKTPPKGSYMVTDVKRNSPMAKKMEAHITHAKYWGRGVEHLRLSEEERKQGPEGHFDANGKPTTPDKAHYGHITLQDKTGTPLRFDYQKQHILHPRLVNVPERKKNKKTGEMETVDHMIPTDSRFMDTKFLPENRFKTKNGKDAGHILMTTPTESTSNIGHQTSFTHNVSDKHIEHAIKNKGEYEIDKPDDQIKAAGKEYRAPQSIKFYAEGGEVGGRHHGFAHDDFHAFPEQNVVAQRHLSMRHGEDEHKPARLKAPVVVHKNTGTMQLEMILKKKAK
jgi:prolyl-tRNA editing enzyme YbaK/EbsC (Cys-tRNA(Pro) deacylase)